MSHTRRSELRRHLAGAVGLPFVLVACVGSVDATDMAATNDSSAEADVEATSAELVSGSLPDGVGLATPPGGLGQRVFTSHGFMFAVAASNTNGMATLQNDSQFLIVEDVQLVLTCRRGMGGAAYFLQFNEHASVKPFSQKATSGRCNSGDSLTQANAAFMNLYSDAPDIGYPANGCSTTQAGLSADNANNGAPDGTINLCSGLTFRNKKRTTWASAEFANNGSSPVTVKQLSIDMACSGGAHNSKKWGPSTVSPGQTMTSTAGCPSGQTVTQTIAQFAR